jgi:hypothetical protein
MTLPSPTKHSLENMTGKSDGMRSQYRSFILWESSMSEDWFSISTRTRCGQQIAA